MANEKIEPAQNILIVDDEEIMHDVLCTLLKREGYGVEEAWDGDQALELFSSRPFDLTLLDLMLPGRDGMEILREIRLLDPHAVVVIITAFGTIEKAVQATRDGAFDFITKPFKNEEIALVVKNGIRQRRLLQENLFLKQSFRDEFSFDAIIGKSRDMQEIYRLIRQVAPTKSTILIEGESGTGKELVAKAVHNASPRSDSPFVPLNCGNIPSELMESELFGYRKGAFTGAVSSKKGLFEVAAGGTLFLDEIGNLGTDLQGKLLRAIQEREFRQLGGIDNIKVDVRIIAASNEDLKDLAARGKFREDLFYRLNVIRISIPPLRQRKEDIPLLVAHFIDKICKENGRTQHAISKDAMETLMNHSWPGNVRELENVLERAVVLSDAGGVISPHLFPPEVRSAGDDQREDPLFPEEGVCLKDAVSDFERRLIVAALDRTTGSQKRAAQLLKMNATTLSEKIRRLKIHAPRYDPTGT